jgi:hypothetical protein
MCVIQGATLNNSANACAVETPRSGTDGVPSLRGLLQIGTEENPSMAAREGRGRHLVAKHHPGLSK